MSEKQTVIEAKSEESVDAPESEETKTKKPKTVPEIHICEEFCKGCDICVDACPKNCLALENGTVAIVDAGACTGCGLCELRCPDFAIWIGDIDQ